MFSISDRSASCWRLTRRSLAPLSTLGNLLMVDELRRKRRRGVGTPWRISLASVLHGQKITHEFFVVVERKKKQCKRLRGQRIKESEV